MTDSLQTLAPFAAVAAALAGFALLGFWGWLGRARRRECEALQEAARTVRIGAARWRDRAGELLRVKAACQGEAGREAAPALELIRDLSAAPGAAVLDGVGRSLRGRACADAVRRLEQARLSMPADASFQACRAILDHFEPDLARADAEHAVLIFDADSRTNLERGLDRLVDAAQACAAELDAVAAEIRKAGAARFGRHFAQ